MTLINPTHRTRKSATQPGRYFTSPFYGMLIAVFTSICLNLAVAENVGIIYPSVSEPFQRVFSEIKSGINAQNAKPLPSFMLDDNSTAIDLSRWQNESRIDRLIVLGNRAKNFIKANAKGITELTYGAIRNIEIGDDETAVSIIPAPQATLSQMLAIAPEVKRVFLIKNTNNGDNLASKTIIVGKGLGLDIQVREAASPQAFAQALREIVDQMQPKNDAFWLSHNAEPINKKLLQRTLVDAWNRNLIIFSSNLADVKHGALFAVFPDNKLMGTQLFELAQRHKAKELNRLEYAKHLHVALNRRSASHLGLNFSRNELKLFKLVYPPY